MRTLTRDQVGSLVAASESVELVDADRIIPARSEDDPRPKCLVRYDLNGNAVHIHN